MTTKDMFGRLVAIATHRRVLVLFDQGFFSAGNFIVTFALARLYSPNEFAAFGVALAIALTIQIVQRTTIVAPMSLLSDRVFRVRRAGLAGQHVIVLALVVTVVGGFVLLRAHDEKSLNLGVSLIACLSLYFGLDFDRALLIKMGRNMQSTLQSFLFFVASAGFATFAAFSHVHFVLYMALVAAFALVKTTASCLAAGRIDLLHGYKLQWRSFQRNFGWAGLGAIASTGYSHLPQMILAASGAPNAATAAYAALRTPIQPLMIVLRGFDNVDKAAYSRTVGIKAQRLKSLKTLTVYLALAVAFVVVTSIFSRQIVALLLGETYAPHHATFRMWAIVFTFIACCAPLESFIFKQQQYRTYALIQMVGAVVSVGLAWPLSRMFLDIGAVGACLCGWIVVYIGIFICFFYGNPKPEPVSEIEAASVAAMDSAPV